MWTVPPYVTKCKVCNNTTNRNLKLVQYNLNRPLLVFNIVLKTGNDKLENILNIVSTDDEFVTVDWMLFTLCVSVK